jgi:membrane fusion protein (multidrug efflux system)
VLERGQDVVAHSETYPNREFAGVVASVDSRVDPVTRSVTVRAEVPNPDRLLRPGMLLSVRLLQEPRRAIVVPEIAVIQVGTEAFVYRVGDDRTASRVQVELGARRRGEVEVVSGLAAGDTIVTEGAVKLRDGSRVTSAPAAPAGG